MNADNRALKIAGLAILAALTYVLYQGQVVQPREAMLLKERQMQSEENARQQEIARKGSLRVSLNICLGEADAAYWSWIKLNMTEKDDGTYWGSNYNWDKAADDKKAAEDACYRKYSE